MKTIATLLVSTLLIGSAYAQAAATNGDSERDAQVEKQIKDLHAKLKITSEEESQWAVVAKTMKDNAQDMDKVAEKRESLGNNATAIDDLNAYSDIAQAHADGVKKLSTAFAPLYTAMSDNQKKLADAVFMQHPHGKNSVAKAQ